MWTEDDYKRLTKTADRFIDLANSMVDAGAEPEVIGDGMLYGAARYASFLSVRAETATGVARGLFVENLLDVFREHLQHNLATMAGPVSDMPEEPAAAMRPMIAADDPEHAIIERTYLRIARAHANLDVALAGYLRGKGDPESAAIATMEAAPDGDFSPLREYVRRVYGLWESGKLPEAMAVGVISHLCVAPMQHNAKGGYIKDPALDAESKRAHVEFYQSLGLHKLATMMRHDPRHTMQLVTEGMAMLVGPDIVEFEAAMKRMQQRPPAA